MRRDMELILRILERAEEIKPGSLTNESYLASDLKIEDESQKDILFEHVDILFQEGFIRGRKPSREQNSSEKVSSFEITGVKWKGYDLIDSIRNKP